MSLFNIVKEGIRARKENRLSGKFNGIPFPFSKLSEYIPSIDPGQSIGLLAPTGCGKSRTARFMFIYHAYKFYKQFGYPIQILLFPLEDSKEKFFKSFICHYLFDLFGIKVSLAELDSRGDKMLPDFVEAKIAEAEEFFQEFESVVTLIDGAQTPQDIYRVCLNHAKATGRMEKYTVELDGEQVVQKRYVRDIPLHTIVIIDNISNVEADGEQIKDDRSAVEIFAKRIIREKLCNVYNFTVVQILQLDFQSERAQFSTSGQMIVGKLEPTLAGVGDAKRQTRSMHIVLSLFDPNKHELLRYPTPSKLDPENCYDIDILKDKFRSLKILKNNDGAGTGRRIGILFDGLTETLEELPFPKTPELKFIYDSINNKTKNNFVPVKKSSIFEEQI